MTSAAGSQKVTEHCTHPTSCFGARAVPMKPGCLGATILEIPCGEPHGERDTQEAPALQLPTR